MELLLHRAWILHNWSMRLVDEPKKYLKGAAQVEQEGWGEEFWLLAVAARARALALQSLVACHLDTRAIFRHQ